MGIKENNLKTSDVNWKLEKHIGWKVRIKTTKMKTWVGNIIFSCYSLYYGYLISYQKGKKKAACQKAIEVALLQMLIYSWLINLGENLL